MRIGFVTCVQLGLHCLEAVAASGGRFDLLITLPGDAARAKSGRVDVDDFCARTDTPLLKVPNINDPLVVDRIRGAALDWLLIVGWSQIARRPVLDAARLGTLGMHPTLLPKGRGRASLPWAIIKQLPETGVTLFKLDDGVDSGPIAAQATIALAPDETATTLYEKVSATHAQLLIEAWPRLLQGTLQFREQDHAQATLWPGRKPEDGNLASLTSVVDAERLVRAVTRPYPGAFLDGDGGRVRVWNARIAAAPCARSPIFLASQEVIAYADGALQLLDWELEQLRAC
jgi:methionyl-tRNA formyltransferase